MSWTIHNGYLPSTAFGACFKCRAAQRPGERILDPNLVTDDLPPELVTGMHDGHVMFCEACITEAANELGMQTPLQVASLVEELAQVTADAERLALRAAAAESAVSALRQYDASHPQTKVRSTAGTTL